MINHASLSSFYPDDFKLIADEPADTWQASRPDRRMRTTAAEPPTAAALTKLELDRIKVTFEKINEKSKNEIKEKWDRNRTENKIDKNCFKNIQLSKDSFFKASAVCCKSWFCEKCRKNKGHELRNKLLEKAELIKVPRLYTITVNREWFNNPQEAFKYIMDKKFIARLLTKEMGIRRWIWVLEAQEENGDGWPHWHILLDIGDLPTMWYNKDTQEAQEQVPANKTGWVYIPHYFDLNKAHRLLTKWKVGKQCKLSVRRDSFNTGKHAVFYITKYLIKAPGRGFPPWMLETPRIRFYASSRDLSCSDEPAEPETEKKKYNERQVRIARRPVERVAECCKKVVFSVYDSVKDCFVFSPPVWGIKDSLQHMPGAVQIQDFDFRTQNAFPVWGFKSLKDLKIFDTFWNNSELLKSLSQNISNKQQELLTQWSTA